MAKLKVNNKLEITGTSDKQYDLDEIIEDSRANSEKPLIVQVHSYSAGESPNPSNLQVGQFWVSVPKK